MSRFAPTHWPRRIWLKSQALNLAALGVRAPQFPVRPGSGWSRCGHPSGPASCAARVAAQAERLDPAPWQVLAQQAVDAARTAGARYADAHLTRMVRHSYGVGQSGRGSPPNFREAVEYVGVGVRALVKGYWGFSASAVIAPDEVVRLARDAVAQAQENAKGPPWTVDLGTVPIATGMWATPHRIDPFTIPIEEKQDFIVYWKQCAEDAGVDLEQRGFPSWLRFVRQERVVATSEGALFTQTIFESGGEIICALYGNSGDILATQNVHGIDVAGAGWERFLDAQIQDQYSRIKEELTARAAIGSKPVSIGKYTLVCDGATMAALVESTLGVATQLDRALGYEANASGTCLVDDPLAMVGALQVAAPLVTLTANRSAPTELATVKWDEEGVVPEPFTLIKDGVLTDFQTTREQAAWLAPYYQQHHQPVRSHGCAAVESAHVIPMQHMPNLALEPSASAIRLVDLVADVPDGILVEGGAVAACDFQERTGLLEGVMREIKHGRLGPELIHGAVSFNTKELWKNLQVVGGLPTQAVIGSTQFIDIYEMIGGDSFYFGKKGQPPQQTSHSVRAVAATIPNQPVINPESRK